MSKILVIDRPTECIYRKQFGGITSDCHCTKPECRKGNYVLVCKADVFPQECPLISADPVCDEEAEAI